MKKYFILILVLLTIYGFSQSKGLIFPDITGVSLDDKPFIISKDGNKNIQLIGICYKRSAEEQLKQWILPIYQTFIRNKGKGDFYSMTNYENVAFSFVPLISGLKSVKNKFKESTQKELWKYVIDCNTDIKALKALLKPANEKIPYFYLLDTDNKILMEVSGDYSDDKLHELLDAIP